MRNIIKLLAPLVLISLLLLSACAPDVTRVPAFTQEVFSTPELTLDAVDSPVPPISSPKVTHDEETYAATPWEQLNACTAWAQEEYTYGITRENTPASVPDSVMMMLPLIELMLEYRTRYDFCYDDLQYFKTLSDTNQNKIDNEVYLWGLMAYLFCRYGDKHPDVTVSADDATAYVPEAAAREFLEVCFSEYTQDFALPKSLPRAWTENPISYGGSASGEFMVFREEAYIFTRSIPTLMERYIITTCKQFGETTYYLDILELYGWNCYDIASYHVELTHSESPSALGLEWRVSRIIRIDTSNLWARESESTD